MILVTASVFGVFALRGVLDKSLGANGQTVVSLISNVQIFVLNYASYHYIAVPLTDYENHRTYTNYEDAMGLKLFLFQFVNSYAGFFYLAFVAQV